MVEYETKLACNLQGEVIHGKRIFSKLFWAFNACIEGFPFCKRMIQVDGTWLYGKYGHILLIAVAQDGDSNIFPVAFAIVEKEDAEGWEFFLKHLRNHVVKEDGPPHAYPAYCVRHIVANAKTRFGNNHIRKDILGAGYEVVQPIFDARIRKLRRHGQHVFDFANDIPVKGSHKPMMKVGDMAI
ncbi:hypothetical protein GQ457_13G010230 [Hibiscus cannabinus]